MSPHDEHVDLLRSMSAVWGRDAFVAAVAEVLGVEAGDAPTIAPMYIRPPMPDDFSDRIRWIKEYRAAYGAPLKQAKDQCDRLYPVPPVKLMPAPYSPYEPDLEYLPAPPGSLKEMAERIEQQRRESRKTQLHLTNY